MQACRTTTPPRGLRRVGYGLVCSLLGTIVAMAAAPPDARAARGDYPVQLTSTAAAGWQTWGFGGPFLPATMKVEARAGAYQAGAVRYWRVGIPGDGATIAGGTIAGSVATPDAGFRGRITVGSDGGAVRTLLDSDGSQAFELQVPGGNDWLQFDLRTPRAVRVTTGARTRVAVTRLNLLLRDHVAPRLAMQAVPGPGWYGPACVPIRVVASDQGSGIRSVRLVRTGDVRVLSTFAPALAAGTRPGASEHVVARCLGAGDRQHGTASYAVEVEDVGGWSHRTTFTLRSDLLAPTITGLPAGDLRLDRGDLSLRLDVADDASGVAAVAATLDGSEARVAQDAGSWTVAALDALPVGRHVLQVTATDSVGNVHTERRTVLIGDVTAPTLEVLAPGASGVANPWLQVRGVDGQTGIDPSSWRVELNGRLVPMEVGVGTVTATPGPLAPGPHRIVVRVTDHAGNEGRITHAYDVTELPAPGTPAVGGRSGVFLLAAATTPVPWATRRTVPAFVVRSGQPVPAQAVVARMGNTIIGRGTTGPNGIAQVVIVPRITGAIVFAATGVPTATRRVAVAPRLLLPSNPRATTRMRPTTLSGRMLPGLAGRTITVQARINGSWVVVRRYVRVGAGGVFSTQIRSSARGRIPVRVVVPAGGGWATGISNQRLLVVR